MNSKLLLEAKKIVASQNGFQTWLHVEEENMVATFIDKVAIEYEHLLRIGKSRKQRRDYFAGCALQALISKLPLFDQQGEQGNVVSEQEIQSIKKGLSESAWAYADFMLYTEGFNQ